MLYQFFSFFFGNWKRNALVIVFVCYVHDVILMILNNLVFFHQLNLLRILKKKTIIKTTFHHCLIWTKIYHTQKLMIMLLFCLFRSHKKNLWYHLKIFICFIFKKTYIKSFKSSFDSANLSISSSNSLNLFLFTYFFPSIMQFWSYPKLLYYSHLLFLIFSSFF